MIDPSRSWAWTINICKSIVFFWPETIRPCKVGGSHCWSVFIVGNYLKWFLQPLSFSFISLLWYCSCFVWQEMFCVGSVQMKWEGSPRMCARFKKRRKKFQELQNSVQSVKGQNSIHTNMGGKVHTKDIWRGKTSSPELYKVCENTQEISESFNPNKTILWILLFIL